PRAANLAPIAPGTPHLCGTCKRLYGFAGTRRSPHFGSPHTSILRGQNECKGGRKREWEHTFETPGAAPDTGAAASARVHAMPLRTAFHAAGDRVPNCRRDRSGFFPCVAAIGRNPREPRPSVVHGRCEATGSPSRSTARRLSARRSGRVGRFASDPTGRA